jgi:segregation and condensation protein B
MNIKNIIEAAIFASGSGLSLDELQNLFELEERPSKAQLSDQLLLLQQDYQDRGIELVNYKSLWRFQTVSSTSDYVARLWQEKPQKYSRALLETLSIIAFKQPVTRAEIEQVRGVAVSSSIMNTLIERDWIKSAGQKEVPGRPSMYSTTENFLAYFNLNALTDLPSSDSLLEKYQPSQASAQNKDKTFEQLLMNLQQQEQQQDQTFESIDTDLQAGLDALKGLNESALDLLKGDGESE